ncbi:MAG: M24 family metallopeptidase [Clostridiaceae bacterium]|nr:M24 family metallopeptidase [Clostridiaceae bacterium]
MSYSNKLSLQYFVDNRTRLIELMSQDSLAVFCAGRPEIRTADQKHAHFADRSFFYLSGIEQEQAILLIGRTSAGIRQILFIPPTDMMHERWNGHIISREEAVEASGIEEIYYLEAFEGMLADLFESDKPLHIWLDRTAANRQAQEIQEFLRELVNRQGPDSQIELRDVSPQLVQLRMIKTEEELNMIRAASALTLEGIMSMLTATRPGMYEYQLMSEFEYTLAQAGCLEPAFPSIVAAGKNALCLHYMQPYDKIAEGDLIQIDLGAIVGGLCADISRVIPASGKFSERQLELYEMVRACQEEAFRVIKPGIKLADINQACRAVAAEGLKKMGLLNDASEVGNYFWHGVSHHLGLDVHDISNREAIIQPGMVLTVEPGIYIPEWQMGMRLEDDVAVTENGCSVLSAAIPREAHEIESLMRS